VSKTLICLNPRFGNCVDEQQGDSETKEVSLSSYPWSSMDTFSISWANVVSMTILILEEEFQWKSRSFTLTTSEDEIEMDAGVHHG